MDDDWRLQGQEKYLQGSELHRARWTRLRPGWDHDHCAFCWAKFAEAPEPGALDAGYTTADGYYWVCPACFEDFRERFGWRVAGEPTAADPQRP